MKDAQSSEVSSEFRVSVGGSWLGNWLDSRTGYRALSKVHSTSECQAGLVGVMYGEARLFLHS